MVSLPSKNDVDIRKLIALAFAIFILLSIFKVIDF